MQQFINSGGQVALAICSVYVAFMIFRVYYSRPGAVEHTFVIPPIIAWLLAKGLVHVIRFFDLFIDLDAILLPSVTTFNAIAAIIATFCIKQVCDDTLCKPTNKELRAVTDGMAQTVVQLRETVAEKEKQLTESKEVR